MDLLFIEILAIFILESSDKLIELSVDKSDNIRFLKPNKEWASDSLEIKSISDVLLISTIWVLLSIQALSHHSHPFLSDLLIDKLILLIFIIHESAWSSSLHVLPQSLILVKSSLNFDSSLHWEFILLNDIIYTLSFIIVKFWSCFVIIFHVIFKVITFDVVLWVSAHIVLDVVNVLVIVLFSFDIVINLSEALKIISVLISSSIKWINLIRIIINNLTYPKRAFWSLDLWLSVFWMWPISLFLEGCCELC